MWLPNLTKFEPQSCCIDMKWEWVFLIYKTNLQQTTKLAITQLFRIALDTTLTNIGFPTFNPMSPIGSKLQTWCALKQ